MILQDIRSCQLNVSKMICFNIMIMLFDNADGVVKQSFWYSGGGVSVGAVVILTSVVNQSSVFLY